MSVNRYGPKTPPRIPQPANQSLGGGYYSDMAKSLSGVPGLGGPGKMDWLLTRQHPMLQALMGLGGGIGGGINGIDPNAVAKMYAARTHPLIAALYGLSQR